MHELPPETQTSATAAFGTAQHYLMNGTIEEGYLLQEELWKEFGLEPVKRNLYTERELRLRIGDEEMSGHPS